MLNTHFDQPVMQARYTPVLQPTSASPTRHLLGLRILARTSSANLLILYGPLNALAVMAYAISDTMGKTTEPRRISGKKARTQQNTPVNTRA